MRWWVAFFRAGFSTHARALKELIIILLISTSPISLGALVNYAVADAELSYFNQLKLLLGGGELFLYCMSIVATIFFLTNIIWRSEDNFQSSDSRDEKDEEAGHSGSKAANVYPPKLWFNLVCLASFGICWAFAGIKFIKGKFYPEIFNISAVLYIFVLLVYYVVLILRDLEPPDLRQSMNKKATTLGETLKRMRGQ